MKIKSIITTVLITVFGAVITLFIYTRLIDRPDQNLIDQDNGSIDRTPPVTLTSMQVQEGPVDLTYALN